MKRIFIICLIAITSSCAAQKTNISTDIPDEFFQRWELDYGKDSNGNLISGLPESPENDYEFKKDGTYIIYFTLVPAGKAVKNTPFENFRFHYKPAID